ncbi:HesA/MoeB/ThiF family protein [Candidatus Woesearchaeota archaeon]|nr:HesA/MoeB/ThiF family protein [Candidatus Woesearchaeota archaeon]
MADKIVGKSRYSRNITLRIIGEEGQKTLRKKTVSIVGLGAIGTVVAELLSRLGVNLILIDNDKIDISNLQRQLIYNENDIGKYKTDAACKKLKKINSEIKIKKYRKTLTKNNLNILDSDLILDCTDNLKARFLINEYCLLTKMPWIHAAAIKTHGVLCNFTPADSEKPCFACIYKKNSDIETCEDSGVFNGITVLVATLQATQALKMLLNYKIMEDFLRIDIWNENIERLKVKKDTNCKICQMDTITQRVEIGDFTLKLCKTKAAYSVKPFRNVRLNLNQIKNVYTPIIETPLLLIVKIKGYEVIVHNYGELIFKDLKNEVIIKQIAKDVYSLGDSSKLKIKQKH